MKDMKILTGLFLGLVVMVVVFSEVWSWVVVRMEAQKIAQQLLTSEVVERDPNMPHGSWNRFNTCLKRVRQSKQPTSRQIQPCLDDYGQERQHFYHEREIALTQEINTLEKPPAALYFTRGQVYKNQGKCWRAIYDLQNACFLGEVLSCELLQAQERCSKNVVFYAIDLWLYNNPLRAKRSLPMLEKLVKPSTPLR